VFFQALLYIDAIFKILWNKNKNNYQTTVVNDRAYKHSTPNMSNNTNNNNKNNNKII